MTGRLPHDGWEQLDHRDKGWHAFHYIGWYAVVPLCDLEIHEAALLECPCQPWWDPASRTLLHRAFDGRDLVERVEQGLRIV